MSGERLCLIVNPRSAGGATGHRLGALRRAVDRWFDGWELWTTEGPRHACTLAARAAEEGFDVVAAVGGDGTASEVVHGLFHDGAPRNPGIVFSVIPAGTGSDLVKTLGMPADLEEAVRVVAEREARPTDVVRVRLTGEDGGELERICINVAGFGMNGEVVRRANRSSKRLGGTATFAIATLQTLRSYQPGPVSLRWIDGDGTEGGWEGDLSSVFIANGQFCGGGMWVGRGGAMDDGLLEVTIIPKLPLRRMLISGPRLFTGTVDHVKNVSTARVREISARPLGHAAVRVDVDGEQPGVLPINASVLPKSLLVRGIWPCARKTPVEAERG